MQQLLCHETIPVSEEENDSEHDEVFLRVKKEMPRITNLLYTAKLGDGSDQTTRDNSKKGSVLVPQQETKPTSISEMLRDVTNEKKVDLSFSF